MGQQDIPTTTTLVGDVKYMEKQSFISKLTTNVGPTYTRQRQATSTPVDIFSKEHYNKTINPKVREMVEAMALRESTGGKYRINEDDQGVGKHSYGLLQMGQPAVDEFVRKGKKFGYTGGAMKASDLMGPQADQKQKYMQGIRIQEEIGRNGGNLLEATRKIQNPRDADYGTSTLQRYLK